ncbi:universal stress protein [Amycolatopsis dendrobii]|uniref:Universal stress protein n=1 Tax=Amycolatopsis dendrobii TaxID=2760662 RepID=A0A7W3W648_9PSEU|nr:universal stress protein [Amycolatopsis dendrobii]MBB1159516.1 universal stress protein [Amycolatopsis dendrobii]
MIPPVVAGVDGSAESLAAVRWAAAQARPRGSGLVVFRAELFADPDLMPHGKPPAGTDLLLEPGYRLLRQAADEARRAVPEVRVRMCLRLGAAAGLLAAQSAEAGLLVLGSPRAAGVRGGVTGSVALSVAASARCPVAVVRGYADPEGPVVVGVDDSGGSERALAFAFETADVHRAVVEAVHVRHDDDRESGVGEQVEAWSRKYPAVPVRVRALRARSAGRALAGISPGARLVVVGSRGRGPVAGGLLGSTGNGLLAHASCPVVVAR